ncbi:M13 family metallopeptidase [Acidobacteria bacterium AB60]|nr:M13 family metallopeptidase [Acidobacteria bacterium AB60]
MRSTLPASLLLALGCLSHCLAQTDASLPKLPHVDLTNVDPSVSPCADFYQYVCGKINAANPIPPDEIWWGPAEELQNWNRAVLHQILEKNKAPDPARSPNEQKIGDFYASCMNQPAEGELAEIQPILERISAMKDKRDIAATLALIHSSFGRAWEGSDNQTNVALLGYGPGADYNDVSRVVAGVDQGGLGMPGRDFYLKSDDDSKKIRDQYVTFIVSLLKLTGVGDADATRDAATILRVETAMAQSHMDNITRRDPNKVNNRYTLATLKALTPAFDWDAYLRGLNAPQVPLYEVSSPDFFRTLNKLLTAEDLATWKLYLRFHTLRSAAPPLGKAWRDASFELLKTLLGQQQQDPDWRRCAIAVDHYMGEALGQVYVAQVFPPESKARALKMVKDIESAMGRDIDSVSWMQATTKKEAHQKLAAVIEKIGYPDNWIDYSSLSISRDSYLANVERATAFELKRQLAFIGHPLDRKQWVMTPPTVDAYEDPQTNTINFPAGMLQPPFFDAAADDVLNYGAEGAIMGHEMTHDFDDQGRKFDVKGNLRDWWTPEDAKQYEQRGSCIAHEYTGPVPGIAGVEQNGKLTQGEDTADNGGIYLALAALSEDLKQQGKSLDDKDAAGRTNLQRFFIAFATGWCDQIRPEAIRTLILTNPHSAPFLRVNNVVANMPEFQKAFGCKAGDAEVHAKQCRVW